MADIEDIIGSHFGRLNVVSITERGKRARYLCRCECGSQKSIRRDHLLSGKILSCGCLKVERTKVANTTHGDANRVPEYHVWLNMRARCSDPNTDSYPLYGGRGISVCLRWSKYENFIADMGRRPSEQHSIERVDRDGNYEPFNCRWATRIEQARNKRTNRIIEAFGIKATLAEWSARTGLDRRAIAKRLKRGWTLERSLSGPIVTAIEVKL